MQSPTYLTGLDLLNLPLNQVLKTRTNKYKQQELVLPTSSTLGNKNNVNKAISLP
ncbi:MAG: hypothetical protein COA63_014020 [Methylophaga sp.]|nr:hypothetical protein [Methylophaga sp.]